MSTTEKTLAQLRDAEPMARSWLLADIAKTYGDGFAAVVAKQIEREIEARRK